jgi:hypothetical protein
LNKHYPDSAQRKSDDEGEPQGGFESIVISIADSSIQSGEICEVNLVCFVFMAKRVPRLKFMAAMMNSVSAKRAAMTVQHTSVDDLLRY